MGRRSNNIIPQKRRRGVIFKRKNVPGEEKWATSLLFRDRHVTHTQHVVCVCVWGCVVVLGRPEITLIIHHAEKMRTNIILNQTYLGKYLKKTNVCVWCQFTAASSQEIISIKASKSKCWKNKKIEKNREIFDLAKIAGTDTWMRRSLEPTPVRGSPWSTRFFQPEGFYT